MSYTEVDMNPRARAIALVDSGIIDPITMLEACIKYMSRDDVDDMLRANDFEENLYEEEAA